MSVAGTVGTGSFRLVTGTAERIRADAVLYLFIALYTIAGLAFLAAVGALDRAAYSIYVVQWAIVFGMMMPTIAMNTFRPREFMRTSAGAGMRPNVGRSARR